MTGKQDVARGLASRLRLKLATTSDYSRAFLSRQGPGISSEIETDTIYQELQQHINVARGLASRLRLKPEVEARILATKERSPGAWHLV